MAAPLHLLLATLAAGTGLPGAGNLPEFQAWDPGFEPWTESRGVPPGGCDPADFVPWEVTFVTWDSQVCREHHAASKGGATAADPGPSAPPLVRYGDAETWGGIPTFGELLPEESEVGAGAAATGAPPVEPDDVAAPERGDDGEPAPEYAGEPKYSGEPEYAGEPGYSGEPGYLGEPEPGYFDEPEPGYFDEPEPEPASTPSDGWADESEASATPTSGGDREPAPTVNPGPVRPTGGVDFSGLGNLPLGSSGCSEATLVALVIAVAALPVIVYATDGPAPPEAKEAWRRPRTRAHVRGLFLPDVAGPVIGFEATSTVGPIGVGGELELGFPYQLRNAGAFVLLRPPPKMHIDGGLAVGWRRSAARMQVRTGIEVALPHRYLIAPRSNRDTALEIRPALLFGGGGVDARLDAGIALALGPITSSMGVRVYSFDESVFTGLYASVGMRVMPRR